MKKLNFKIDFKIKGLLLALSLLFSIHGLGQVGSNFLTQLAQKKEMVLIGDSHSCGFFGAQLLKSFQVSHNTHLTVYCVVSSAPTHWLKGQLPQGTRCQKATTDKIEFKECAATGKMPSLQQILNQHTKADLIIALGTNSLLDSQPDQTYNEFLAEIQKSKKNCHWIGPPHLNPAQSKGYPAGRLQQLENNLNSFVTGLQNLTQEVCKYVDSRAGTREGTSGFQTFDGVHRNAEGGTYWALEIYKELNH